MTLIAHQRIKVDYVCRRSVDSYPEEDKSRPGTEQRKDVAGAVELAVEEFAKKIRSAEGFALIEPLLIFVGNGDQLQDLTYLCQLF